jgi:hypothetical protein
MTHLKQNKMANENINEAESSNIAKPNVVRRIYMEMIHERNHVENNPKYTVSYREGYSEAVRCLGVIIKQLTSEDVRLMAHNSQIDELKK